MLDTFFQDFNGNALQFLAKSIEKLAEADVAYFAPDWKGARGCRIEHECAVEYGIDRIEPDPVDKDINVPVKPRLAEVLGVEVGERFTFRDGEKEIPGLFIRKDGCLYDSTYQTAYAALVCDCINHPESIIRAPRLTEAELERSRAFGVKYLTRNGDKQFVHMWGAKPEKCTDSGVPYYIIGNSRARDIGVVDCEFFPSVRPGDCIELEEEK